MAENIPYRRRLFLLKRWRDERIVYLLSSFSDSAYMQDATLQKIGLHLSYLRRQRYTSRHRKSRLMERMRRRIVDPLRAVKGTPDHLHK